MYSGPRDLLGPPCQVQTVPINQGHAIYSGRLGAAPEDGSGMMGGGTVYVDEASGIMYTEARLHASAGQGLVVFADRDEGAEAPRRLPFPRSLA